jgi:hypothetical protein
MQGKRNPTWLMLATVVSIIVGTAWNVMAGLALFIASVGVTFYLTRGNRTPGLAAGGIGLSDTCESCGGLLQVRLGSPLGVCPSCGHVQSWV